MRLKRHQEKYTERREAPFFHVFVAVLPHVNSSPSTSSPSKASTRYTQQFHDSFTATIHACQASERTQCSLFKDFSPAGRLLGSPTNRLASCKPSRFIIRVSPTPNGAPAASSLKVRPTRLHWTLDSASALQHEIRTRPGDQSDFEVTECRLNTTDT